MKKIVIVLTLLLSWSFADSALLLKKGWQLIGSTLKIQDLNIFEAKNVEQVWHYDAITQKWKGYSPDDTIQTKITQEGYSKIDSLESWHGFWVKSKTDWALSFQEDTVQSDDNITLKQGWNLISLPINSVVSAHIFDEHTVWKYSSKDEWEFFSKEKKNDFPTISHIANGEGIWVKSNKDQRISVASESAKLHNFENIDDAEAYIRDMALSGGGHMSCGYYPMEGIRQDTMTMVNKGQSKDDGNSNSSSSGAESFDSANKIAPQVADDASGTNLQEKGVDESDIVKNDGTNIFYVSNPSNSIGSTVNVTTFEKIVNNDLKPSSKIQIYGYVDSLYLVGDRLVVLTNYNPKVLYYLNGMDDKTIDRVFEDSTLVDIFDVSDISNIQKISSYKINGNLNNSRAKDGKLFLVTTFNPHISHSYPHKIYVDAPECKEYFGPRDENDPYVEGGGGNTSSESSSSSSSSGGSQGSSGTATPPKPSRKASLYYDKLAKCYGLIDDGNGKYYRPDYDRPEIKSENLLPYMQKDDEEKEVLINPKTFFAPSKKDQERTITTISMINIPEATLEKTTSFIGHNETIYASPKAIYLVSTKYPIFINFDRYENRSIIYKVSLDSKLEYKSFGFVKGSILNQFNLSEYQDILRVATTQGDSWQGNTNNSIFTMKDINNSLLIKGVLSGLGEEGETIKSVRFIGDRGYVVTFRQTDPFYTIDLSNPASPRKAGELKIDGFSAYLHPIDENYILGIGRDATPQGETVGLKLELFNISDFSNPISESSHSFGSVFSYSEMLHNHKALAYRDSDKLLGFSYNSRDYSKGITNFLGVFQIEGNTIKAYKTLKSPAGIGDYNRRRGLIFDFGNKTYIAYFANGQIAYSSLDDLKE